MSEADRLSGEIGTLQAEIKTTKSPFLLKVKSARLKVLETRLESVTSAEKDRVRGEREAVEAAELRATKESLADRAYETAIVEGIPSDQAGMLVDLWVNDSKASVDSIADKVRQQRALDATERQRGISNDFREQGMDESKRRWEANRQDRLQRKKDGSLDADKVANGIDREVTGFGWTERFASTLSDDEVRAALAGKTLGPGTREKLEGLAKQRGVTLLPSGAGPVAPSALGEAPQRVQGTTQEAIDQAIKEFEDAGKPLDSAAIAKRANEIAGVG